MSQRIMNRQSGFTMIELLIVISIIAALAAVLLPNYTKNRQLARVAAATQVAAGCLNNAFAVYSAANQGRLPEESVINSQAGLVQFARENDCDLPDGLGAEQGRPIREVRLNFWDYRCLRYDPFLRRIIIVPCNPPWMDPQPQDFQLFLSVSGVDPGVRGSMLVMSGTDGVAQVTKAEGMNIFNLQ